MTLVHKAYIAGIRNDQVDQVISRPSRGSPMVGHMLSSNTGTTSPSNAHHHQIVIAAGTWARRKHTGLLAVMLAGSTQD